LLTLRRAPRNEIPQYRDSEWQAHAFAGALLLPRPALRVVDLNDTYAIGAQFDVSEAFARSHVKRIRRCL
jgi:Zn-dependent peptidase ImmA (M78 family)